MDFKNANELLDLCKKHDLPISEVMRQREIVEGEKEADTVHDAMARVLEIMKNAAFTPIKEPVRSMGGLIGGEAKKIASRYHSGIGICGDLLEKSMIYAMATLETNASMGLIVASPTAGSAGIVPGLLLGLQEVHKLDDEQIIQALFNASAIGYLAMRNATVAGAVGGCQAEVGVASAMAASAVLRAKECVMDTVTTVQENAEDIYEEAKQINEDRAAAEEEMEAYAEADDDEEATEEVSEDAFKEVEE